MNSIKLVALLLIVFSVNVRLAVSEETAAVIGETEKVYTLAPENGGIRGVAFDGHSEQGARLFVLDRSEKMFVYRVPTESGGDLELLQVLELPSEGEGWPLARPRGLTFSRENGRDILYFMTWDDSAFVVDDDADVVSQLWRWDIEANTSTYIDLSRYTNRFGDREPLDLTCDDGDILICFKPDGYGDRNMRVQRGIVRLKWKPPFDAYPEFVRHMPDSGVAPSLGLAAMTLDGAKYVWATSGNDHVYCADGPTGRGLFFFERPASNEKGGSCRGMCFGNGSLWVSEDVPGPDRVHRVNVTRNLDAPAVGPRIVRRLIMTIRSTPEVSGTPDAGKVYHNYSRPYAQAAMPCQGIWPATEEIVELSEASNAKLTPFTYDPAGDTSSRQYMQSIVYGNAPARVYRSRYEINLWTNSYRKFVYPHRVGTDSQFPDGTNYLEDDPELFNLTDKKTYDGFIERIKAHVEAKYGVPADMENPYWAARNTLEYIQDHYYYPNRSVRRPAAVDYARKHYDANPGNLKIELTDHPYDKTQIIACSGTSVMIAGTMRHLGIPARWLGTGTQQAGVKWDRNRNGLLEEGERAPCSNGHRYSQVWLGKHYGWICVDGTPTKPDFNDYDPVPPIQTQWRYMERCAGGHRTAKRIVFNIGSRLFRPLYRDFEFDESLAIHNNCGGDQRYNLQGRFEKPALWRGSADGIAVENLCFIEQVKLHGEKNKTKVAWTLKGAWELDPAARLHVDLEQITPGRRRSRPRPVATLAKGIPYDQRGIVVDLSDYRGQDYRITVRKEGDAETGGYSKTFDLP